MHDVINYGPYRLKQTQLYCALFDGTVCEQPALVCLSAHQEPGYEARHAAARLSATSSVVLV